MTNDCHDVLTREMEAIKVEFKFFEEYNQLVEEKNRNNRFNPVHKIHQDFSVIVNKYWFCFLKSSVDLRVPNVT